MKKMKYALSAIAVMAAGLSVALTSIQPHQVDAGSCRKLLIDESFNDARYSGSYNSNIWDYSGSADGIVQSTSTNVYLEAPVNKTPGDTFYFGTVVKLENIEFVQFDLMITTSRDRDNWIGVNFINGAIDNANLADYTYEFPISFTAETLNTSLTSTFVGERNFSYQFGESSMQNKWFTCRITPTSDLSAEILLARQGGEFDEAKKIVCTFDSSHQDRSFKNAYVGFQACNPNPGYCIDNIHFKEGGEGGNEIIEDFTDNIMSEELGFYSLEGRATTYSRNDNNYLALNGARANDKLISKAIVPVDESVAEDFAIFDASFNVKIPSSSSGEAAFAYAIKNQAAITQDSSMMVFSSSGATLRRFVNGEQTSDDSHNHVSIPSISSQEGANIYIKVRKTGTLVLYVNEEEVATLDEIEGYAGKLGFIALSNIDDDIRFDNLVVYHSTYYVPVTKSVTHNFSNNYWGNAGHEDFFIANNGGGSIRAENGRLKWSGCSDGSFFGSAHQYDEFIMDYKVCSIYVGTDDVREQQKTKVGCWLGLDFSRSSLTKTEYGTYGNYYILINSPRDYDNVYFYKQSGSPYDEDIVKTKQYKQIPASLFNALHYDDVRTMKSDIKDGDHVCVRWVSTGNTLSLYLKKASEPTFDLYFTATNVELNGYFALCCTGFTYLELDDFSMANTSPIYVCADNDVPETIIETETITIYDDANVDVNLDEEINLTGKGGCGGAIVASGIVAGIALISVGVIAFARKRNGDRNE